MQLDETCSRLLNLFLVGTLWGHPKAYFAHKLCLQASEVMSYSDSRLVAACFDCVHQCLGLCRKHGFMIKYVWTAHH